MTKLVTPPQNAVVQGDCINVLSTFAPNSVDMALTDPPYLVR